MESTRSPSEPRQKLLALFFCESLKKEFIQILSALPEDQVRLSPLPHYCTAGPDRLDQIRTLLTSALRPGETGVYFGDALLEKRGLLPPGIRHAGPDICNALVAPTEFVQSLISGGAYVILPGWLLAWEEHVADMGFNPETPTAFYSSSLKETILLDTCLFSIPEERIRSFERFSNLPIRSIPVGISHLSGIVHAVVYQWQEERTRINCNQEVSSALESVATQMSVITLLSDIARVSKESEVISRILTTCQVLFAPRSVRYLPIYPERKGTIVSIPLDENPDTGIFPSALKEDFSFTADMTGFYVPIMYQQERVGLLLVEQVTIPERIREYLNLTLSFTRFLGLAIKNARSWHEINVTKEALEKANIELIDKNDELIAISGELQSSNQELIRNKRELSESEQFIKAIILSARIGITVLDTDFRILFWNPEMEFIFNLPSDTMLGKSFLEIFSTVTDKSREQYLYQALDGKMAVAPDFEISAREGKSSTWISSIFSPVFDLNLHIIGVIINVHDITKRKLDEQELERAYNAIHTAQEKLNILSSITRHDILNRVMVITSYCYLLKQVISDEKAVKQLNNMEIAGKDIQNLIEFTREYQELGVKKPVWQQVDRVVQRRSIQSLLSGIDLHIEGEPVEVYVDPMFEKVLYNLVENSRRHGEHVSQITISQEKTGEELVIAYTDNGTGVPQGEKEIIFKKGYGKHTGMGLFLIREILGLTAITIQECGLPGKGVRFEMKIPGKGWRKIHTENTDS